MLLQHSVFSLMSTALQYDPAHKMSAAMTSWDTGQSGRGDVTGPGGVRRKGKSPEGSRYSARRGPTAPECVELVPDFRPPREETQLLAYKSSALNSINSNHVNHKIIRGTAARRDSSRDASQKLAPRKKKSLVVTLSDAESSKSGLPPAVSASTSTSIAPPRTVTPNGGPQTTEVAEAEHDCKACGCERIRINVSGQYFETRVGILNRHPDTLLGDPVKRQRFYDNTRDEFFLDRHRPSFEAVFCYLQTGGKLRRPHHVPDDVFLAELYFYELETEVVEEYKRIEGYTTEVVHLPSNETMKKIWMLFEYPETSSAAFVIAVISVIMTLVSIVLFCVETLPVFAVSHCVGDEAPNFLDPFFVIETVCTMWFTLEVIIRFLACPSKLGFWKDFKNIVDVTAIIPYYVTFFNVVSTMSCASAKSSASLAFLRVIRLIRVFKLTKHSTGLQVLILTFKASVEGLGLFLVALVVCLLVFSSAIYYAELGVKNSDMDSIPAAFWWAIITMCTVGYGDMVPVGPLGRFIGALCAIVGVLTLAIPVPIITGNFNRFYSHKTGRGRHV